MVGLPFKGNLLDNYQKTKFPIQIYFIPVSCYLLLIKNISFLDKSFYDDISPTR